MENVTHGVGFTNFQLDFVMGKPVSKHYGIALILSLAGAHVAPVTLTLQHAATVILLHANVASPFAPLL